MLIRRAAIAVTLALASAFALTPAAHAARGSAPDGTYVTCNGVTALNYLMVGHAPIPVWDSADLPIAQPSPVPNIDCSVDGEGPGVSPWYPADGTFVQGYLAGAPQPDVYVVVGGAPLWVRGWDSIGNPSSPTVEPFDNRSLPPAGGPDQTVAAGTPAYGMFSSIVRNGYFKNKTGTYFRTDAAGHPVVLPGALAGRPTPPTVSQESIDTCERMNCSPWGDISVQVVGQGQIRVSGYALDAMNSAPLTVHLDAAGQSYDIVANQPDPSINSGYGISGNFGFDRVLTVPAGHYDLCTTFLGYAPGGTSTQAGCQVLDVPGSVPKRVARPKLKAPGHGKLVVRWKPAVTQGSAISEYIVKVSGAGTKQVSGTKHSVVFKHLRPGKTVTAKVRAINGVGAGKYSKASKKVRVR